MPGPFEITGSNIGSFISAVRAAAERIDGLDEGTLERGIREIVNLASPVREDIAGLTLGVGGANVAQAGSPTSTRVGLNNGSSISLA